MATISEVAGHLGVGRETIAAWTIEFAEHLSLTANPSKGIQRHFCESDLQVLALVADFWEEDPDFENIHAMLNSGEHNNDRFSEFALLHTPIFQELPDEIDETWQHGVVVGGMANPNLVQVARAYKTAADELLEQAFNRHEPHEICYPIIFLYRHTLEVYLKAMLKTPPGHHDLNTLIDLLEQHYRTKIAKWVKDRLRDFHRIDRQSDLFRYADLVPGGELWVDFHHLKAVMDRLIEAFEKHITSRGVDRATQ